MQDFRFLTPKSVVFGPGCSSKLIDDILELGLQRVFIVTAPPIMPSAGIVEIALKNNGIDVAVYQGVTREPTFGIVDEAVAAAREFGPDGVVAIGGGAVMDTAKLVAALHNNPCDIMNVLTGNVPKRNTFLATMPTTAGAGSEVSHGSVLYDEEAKVKTGVAHHFLMPDACYIDPLFAVSAPPSVTAGSGFDALSHCIEGYTGKNAHPIADVYSLQGIKLIGASLAKAVKCGDDVEARGNMALGSMFAGKSLVLVNTNAVHALAYPVTGRYMVPHGIANAMFLAEAMEYNLPAAPERFAEVALALGVQQRASAMETARHGVEHVRELARECGLPSGLSALGIPENDLMSMAEEAVGIERLMKNNLRAMTASDAADIYRKIYRS